MRPRYEKLFAQLGASAELLVAMEATGHYWKNLFAALAARGFSVALLNALRTHRFVEEDLQRTKTDAIDALGIARRLAGALAKRPDDEREMLMRVYVDRLLAHLEERQPAHSPADIDAAVAHFIEVLQTP
jgi:transposase